MNMDVQKRQKVTCPFCNQEQAVNTFTPASVCLGLWAKCKNPHCRKEYEIQIFQGKQYGKGGA